MMRSQGLFGFKVAMMEGGELGSLILSSVGGELKRKMNMPYFLRGRAGRRFASNDISYL